jgi:amino-acid N-acetyltransferase
MDITPSTPSDLGSVEALLTDAVLPLVGAAEAFRTGIVANADDRIVGAAAVEPYGDAALLRSVVVSREHRGGGIGRALVAAAEGVARNGGAKELYLLTESAADWFSSLGYRPLGRDEVPRAVAASVEFTEACPTTAIAMHRALNVYPGR